MAISDGLRYEEKEALVGEEMRGSWIELIENSHFEDAEKEQVKRTMGLDQ